MAVNKPRNRTVLFRLSQDEYETLRAASLEKGARSLSDFARAKLLGSIENPTLDAKIAELHNTVARIAELLERT